MKTRKQGNLFSEYCLQQATRVSVVGKVYGLVRQVIYFDIMGFNIRPHSE